MPYLQQNDDDDDDDGTLVVGVKQTLRH